MNWEDIRFKLLTRLVRFYWMCEEWLENCPHPRQHRPIFFIPMAILIPLIISAASFAANLLITSLLAPKPKPQVIGKLTGDISLSDSIFGAPIVRVYGGTPADGSAGGFEVGCNFFWMTDIRVIRTSVPAGTGGGGKGSPTPPPNIRVNYKVDIAGGCGAGRLKLLRLKFNDDTVFGGAGGGGGTPTTPERYEAEDGANILSGGATVVADVDCSGGNKVTGIGIGGSLTFTGLTGDNVVPIEPPDPPEPNQVPYFNLSVFYKSVGVTSAFVQMDGTGGLYTFPDSGGDVGVKYILRPFVAGDHQIAIYHPTLAGPQIDCIDVRVTYITEPNPTGVREDDFPAESPQDNFFLPDPYDLDTNAFERFNAKIPDSIDGVVDVPIINGANLAWYEGTPTQEIDPEIEADITAIHGAGSTPAFRDTAFFRVSDLDFTDYGSIPAVRAVVENIDLKTVSEILIFEALQVGLEETDLDLTLAEGREVRGYVIQDLEAPAKAFEDLGMIHNLNFAENNDGKVVAIDLNDRTPVATITPDDLGAYIAEESDEVPLDDVMSIVPEESEDLIRSMELQFNNPLPPSDYQTDRRAFNFPFTASFRKETRSANITLLPAEAGVIVKRELQKAHLKQAPDNIVVPHKLAWLNAGDVVNLEYDGELRKRRIEEKIGSAPGIYEMALTNEDIYVLADDGTIIEELLESDIAKQTRPRQSFPANTVGTVMEIPALKDEHEGTFGIYAAACSKGYGGWKGARLYWQKGTGYTPIASFRNECAIGVAVNAVTDIPDPFAPGILDPSATLEVDFYGDFNPTTVTTDQAEDGANPYLIGSEVCIVKTWTRDTDYPNRWIGTDIYRAERNSVKHAVDHQVGERVVLLNDAVQFIPVDQDEVGKGDRLFKFVTVGGLLDDAAEISFAFIGDNFYNKESTAPTIGQVFPAEQLKIRIGVRGYKSNAKFRKIEVADNAGMTTALTEQLQNADDHPHSVLPAEFLVTRASGAGNVTKYVRVSHSSNGRDYSEASNVLTVTFATNTGTGGSAGSFSPYQDYYVEVS